jgi:methylated-DNA-[protein]-cysteine S-methyltransferase
MKHYCYYNSPIGRMLLVGKNGVLEELHFPNATAHMEIPVEWQEDDAFFGEILRQLQQYFAGDRREFDLPIAPQGTPFQERVWQELSKIPYGETASYQTIALRIDNPKACRAVGMANSKNPIPIIIPCHRIIGKDGSLTGFGGGLDIKKQLLDLEHQSLAG